MKKTLRWIMICLTAGAVASACTVKTSSSDDDGDGGSGATAAGVGGSGGSTTTTTTSTTTTSTTTGQTGCDQQPDFQSCGQCYCDQDTTGCDSFLQIQFQNLNCGQACLTACDAFCTSGDPMDETAECTTCVNGIVSGDPDADQFIADCQNDAACSSFLGLLQMCPQ